MIWMIALAAILVGALAAGSPAHDDHTVAVSTAGISLGTPAATNAPHRVEATWVAPHVEAELLHVLLLVVLVALWAIAAAGQPTVEPADRGRRPSRRGPPVTFV